METLTTCPRGHALPEDAVFCAICWIRVSQDEEAERIERVSRRRSLVALSVFAASCLAVGVGAAAIIASAPSDAPATAAQPSAAANAIADAPMEQPVAVAVAPLAATVPEPTAQPVTEPVATDCVATVRGDDVACTLTEGRLEFTLCVPDATTLIRVGTRPDNTVKFQDASSDVALGGPTTCADGINATVAIDAYSPTVTWRVVGRDGADKKIWKSRVVTAP